MGFSVVDWVGLASFVGSVAALVKAFKSDGEAKEAREELERVKREREEATKQRDEEIKTLRTDLEVVKNITREQGKRLDDGNNRFDRFETELKATNGLLRELLGALKVKLNLPIDKEGIL